MWMRIIFRHGQSPQNSDSLKTRRLGLYGLQRFGGTVSQTTVLWTIILGWRASE